MKREYLSLILLVERMHRRFLDVIKSELDRQSIEDINNVQTLILYNIGDANLTIGELTNRGYYLGSNVSYNIKKLVESEYLVQERSAHDRRSVKVKLSQSGLELIEKIDELYQKNVDDLGELGFGEAEIAGTMSGLHTIEKYWAKIVSSSDQF